MEPKKAYKTYHFNNAISMTPARRGTMELPEHAAVAVGAPPEFKGSADVWCPEELLLGGVNTCLMLTFLSYARHRQLEVGGIESRAEGIVEHVDGAYQVTRIIVTPVITLQKADDAALAEELLRDAKKGCFISNSVKASVELRPQFQPGASTMRA